MKKDSALGKAGEQRAAEFLRTQGMRVRAVNWRPRAHHGSVEIDIIAHDADCLVFIEVKTRSARSLQQGFTPQASMTRKKQKALLRAIQLYLTETDNWNTPCRIDVVYLCVHESGHHDVEHFENVIDFRGIMDRCHASWQPW